VRLLRDQVAIGMDLPEPLREGSTVSLSAFGYRQDVPFQESPKLELRIEPHSYAVRDQTRTLPRSAAVAVAVGRRIEARIPLETLGDPRRLFLQVRTSSTRTPQGQTPWWIVELRRGPAMQRATNETAPSEESAGQTVPR